MREQTRLQLGFDGNPGILHDGGEIISGGADHRVLKIDQADLPNAAILRLPEKVG